VSALQSAHLHNPGVSYSQLDGVKESRTSAARTSPDLRTPIALLAGASARTIAPQQLRVTRCTPSTGCRSGLTCSTQHTWSVQHLQSASTIHTQQPAAVQPAEQTRAKLVEERWRPKAPLCLRRAAPYRLTQPRLPAGAAVQRGVAHRARARAPLPLGRCTPPRAAPNHSPQLLPRLFNAVAASYRPCSPPPRHSPLRCPPAHTCTTPSARVSDAGTGTPHNHCSCWHSQRHAQPELLRVVAAARAADFRCGTCARNSRHTAENLRTHQPETWAGRSPGTPNVARHDGSDVFP
jgi:hypothetical protein